MGCDIHIYPELKEDNGKWRGLVDLKVYCDSDLTIDQTRIFL